MSAESDSPVQEGPISYEDAFAADIDQSQPQPGYRRLLEQGPVMRPMDGVVMVASRAAVDHVLRHHETFSSRDVVWLGNVRPLLPLSIDPPDHAKYRKILDPLFAPKRMDQLESDISNRANRFIDAFYEKRECNFTSEFAVPFPSSVFLGLMGLPWEELDTFLRLKDGILRPGGESADTPEATRIRDETAQEIYRYFDSILDQREKSPQDDILTLFLRAEVGGDKLTREEILDICFLFLIAGLDTVTDSLTCFFAYLARNADHRRGIAGDPSLIPRAVEELLRWETPVGGALRMATTETEVMGCPVKHGDLVSVMLGAANVDPSEYPDAFVVNFDREVNRHLAFGGGVHRCLGSHLARRELRVTLREWHKRIPEYELRPGLELHYPRGLRTVENLELVW